MTARSAEQYFDLIRAMFVVALSPMAIAGQGTAQDTLRERVFPGPYAGVAWSPVSVSVAGQPDKTMEGLGLHFGVGIHPFARLRGASRWAEEFKRLRLTPHVALTASHLRGIDPEVESIAVAEFSIFGARLTWDATDRFHLFGVSRWGKRSVELSRREGLSTDVDNLWGTAWTSGIGVEFPLVRSGRGIELAVLRSSGTLTSREVVDRVLNEHLEDAKASVPFRAFWLQVGWSGPFTGVSLPWR